MSLKALHLTLLSQEARSNQQFDVLQFLEQLLNQGLMSIGDLYGTEFIPWNCGVSEAIKWIRHSTLANATEPGNDSMEIAWLNNTQHGNDVGRTIICR